MGAELASLDDVLRVHQGGALAAAELRRAVLRTPPSAPVAICENAAASLLRWIRAGGQACTVQQWRHAYYAGSNPAYTLRQLVAASLITDGPHPADRRKRVVRPTAAGRDYAEKLISTWGA